MEAVIYYEVNRFENEIVIFEIVFGMVNGQPYEGFPKIPHIQVRITQHPPITSH
jgi:hypothetical protein